MFYVPLLKDEVAKSFLRSLDKSKIKPYSDKQRNETKRKVEEIINKRHIDWYFVKKDITNIWYIAKGWLRQQPPS